MSGPGPKIRTGTVDGLSSIPGGGMWGVDDSTGNPTPVIVKHS